MVRKDGHIWFTDPAFGSSEKTRELDFYGVYHLSPKGVLEVIARPKGRPNGIALSPDGRILYVDNSDEKNVRAYDVDKNGQASNERVVVSDIDGVPDGMKVDEKGNLYVTAKGVAVLLARRQTAWRRFRCRKCLPIARSAIRICRRCTSPRARRSTACKLDVKGSVQY